MTHVLVFSAICVIFGHGAGEVGYAAGPMSTIFHVYRDGKLSKGQVPPILTIFFRAMALVVGLAIYGYHTMRAMGVKLVKLTPTRGFAAELVTALTVTVASQYDLPQSGILHCGSRGGRGNHGKPVGRELETLRPAGQLLVGSVVVVGFTAAILFSLGVYTPSAVDAKAILTYKTEIATMNANMYKELSTHFWEASAAGALTQLSDADWIRLNTTFADAAKSVKAVADPVKVGTVLPAIYLGDLKKVLATVQQYTVLTLARTTSSLGR